MPQGFAVEGILQITDERRDGTLRDPKHPLRPVNGIVIPKQVIAQLQLRPGLLIRGTPRGKCLDRFESIEGLPPAEYSEKVHLYDGTALDPQPMIRLEHDPKEFTTRAMDIL